MCHVPYTEKPWPINRPTRPPARSDNPSARPLFAWVLRKQKFAYMHCTSTTATGTRRPSTTATTPPSAKSIIDAGTRLVTHLRRWSSIAGDEQPIKIVIHRAGNRRISYLSDLNLYSRSQINIYSTFARVHSLRNIYSRLGKVHLSGELQLRVGNSPRAPTIRDSEFTHLTQWCVTGSLSYPYQYIVAIEWAGVISWRTASSEWFVAHSSGRHCGSGKRTTTNGLIGAIVCTLWAPLASASHRHRQSWRRRCDVVSTRGRVRRCRCVDGGFSAQRTREQSDGVCQCVCIYIRDKLYIVHIHIYVYTYVYTHMYNPPLCAPYNWSY